MNSLVYTDRQIEIMETAANRIDKHGIQELTIKNLAADLKLSEAALYRHFKSKNDILFGLLSYFIIDMKARINEIMMNNDKQPSEILSNIFTSQLNTFVKNPSIVSIIFSEGIFQFNKELIKKVSEMMLLMKNNINEIILIGQKKGIYRKSIASETITTIVMGSIRMVVLKWKLSGNKSNLVKDGMTVLNGVFKMIEKK